MIAIPRHVLERLLLAKTQYQQAVIDCDSGNDHIFTRGVIGLHDALDNFCGAAMTHIGLPMIRNAKGLYYTYLMDAINKIELQEQKTDSGFQMGAAEEIKSINEVRNNAKHQGLLPNVAQVREYLPAIHIFFQENTQKFFGLNWQIIGYSDLIDEQEVKEELKYIEKLIINDKYKESLEKLAILKFKVFDKPELLSKLDKRFDHILNPTKPTLELRKKEYIFYKKNQDLLYGSPQLFWMELGISMDELAVFHKLTPGVGLSRSDLDNGYVLKHDMRWASPNWNEQNVIFCYNFIVDAILKNEAKVVGYSDHPIVINYTISLKKNINIWSMKDDREEIVMTLQEGNTYTVRLLDFSEGKWELYGQDGAIISVFIEGQNLATVGSVKIHDIEAIEIINKQQHQYVDGEWIEVIDS